jgi:Fe-S cluster assembly ATP-binding protein
MGPNGSGKSTLLNAIMGHPRYRLLDGDVTLDDDLITDASPEEKARRGLFLSMQHVPEIAGVTLTTFLHKAFVGLHGSDAAGDPLDFYHRMEEQTKEYGLDPGLLRRPLNHGLSGGEKKRSEVIQLIALRPKIALLDELDSGVDIDALARIRAALERLRGEGMGMLVVSHLPSTAEGLAPDRVTVLREGKVIAEGGREIAETIAENGYDTVGT